MNANKKRKALYSAVPAMRPAPKFRADGTRCTGLSDLPPEVLHILFVEARSTHLPLVNRHFWQTLKQAPDSVRFKYLAKLWEDHQIRHLKKHKCHLKFDKRPGFQHKFIATISSWYTSPECTDMVRVYPLIPWLSCCHRCTTSQVHVYEFVSAFALCTRPVMGMFKQHVERYLSRNVVYNYPTISYPLPKRLFRRWQTPVFMEQPSAELAIDTAPTEVKAVRDISFYSSDDPQRYSAESRLLLERLGLDAATVSEIDLIGPLPPPVQLEFLVYLLETFAGEPNSYNGFPLVMAVYSRAYALMALLLYYGASRNVNLGKPAEVAIYNGDLHAIKLLASPFHEDATQFSMLVKRPDPTAYVKPYLQRTAKFSQMHLKLAVKLKEWAIAEYLWHNGLVTPNARCLELIEKHGKGKLSPPPETGIVPVQA